MSFCKGNRSKAVLANLMFTDITAIQYTLSGVHDVLDLIITI